MKKILTLALFVSAISLPLVSLAADFRTGRDVTLKADESIGSNLYAAGGTMNVAGKVSGDLTVVGGNLVLSGDVGGDVWAAGGSLTVLGAVNGDVRVAGGNVTVNGHVTGDVIAAGGNIVIASGASVGGDIMAAGGNVTVNAPVKGNLRGYAGAISIDDSVAGSVFIRANRVHLGSKASIQGNLTYQSPKDLTMDPGAKVLGNVDFKKDVRIDGGRNAIKVFIGFWFLMKFLMVLILGLLLINLFPRFTGELNREAQARFLPTLGKGLVALVIIPIASVILLVTIIGIPLGLIGFFSYFILLIVASIMSAVIFGSMLDRVIFRRKNPELNWRTVTLGAVILALLYLIPIIGGIVGFIFCVLALGAISERKYRMIRSLRG